MASLYSNENFPIPVVQYLRLLGHDVITIQETGRASEAVSDPEILQFAIETERAVLTLNRKDFIFLHNKDSAHFGIIVCTVDSDFEGQAKCIDTAIQSKGDLRGQLLRVNRPSN